MIAADSSPEVPDGLALRPFDEQDAAAVRDLHDVALMAAGVHLGPGPWDEDLEAIDASYRDAGGEFVVGLVDGRLVAMGALRHVDQTVGEIKRIRVHPRFQRRGFARAMLVHLESQARRRGYRRLRLDTTLMQIAAQRLVESQGFAEVGRGEVAGVSVIYYAKRLA